MELARAYLSEQNGVELVFEDGGHSVEKRIAIYVTTPIRRAAIGAEARYQILRRAREAERDLCFQKYGQSWRSHISHKNYWATTMNDREREIVDEAVSLLISIAQEENVSGQRDPHCLD